MRGLSTMREGAPYARAPHSREVESHEPASNELHMDQPDRRRATDTLANERTYLAYLRTALSFIALGFVIARFSLFQRELSIVARIDIPNKHMSVIFGTSMALAGVFVGVYGALRYISTDSALRREQIKAMPPGAAVVGGIVVAAIGLVVALDLFAFR